MTEQNTNQYPPFHNNNGIPQFQPAPKKKRWFTKPLVWVPAVALLVGVGVGAGSTEAQTIEVERTIEKPVEKIVTKTVEKEVTPAACLEALNLSAKGFTYSSESMEYMNDALQAAGRFDVPALEQANRDLETLNPKIAALSDPMAEASAECRAKAK